MSRGPQVPSLAAGAAARGLTRQHRSAEGALTTTRSLVKKIRILVTYNLIESTSGALNSPVCPVCPSPSAQNPACPSKDSLSAKQTYVLYTNVVVS